MLTLTDLSGLEFYLLRVVVFVGVDVLLVVLVAMLLAILFVFAWLALGLVFVAWVVGFWWACDFNCILFV